MSLYQRLFSSNRQMLQNLKLFSITLMLTISINAIEDSAHAKSREEVCRQNLEICSLRPICEKYKSARYACSTAGDIEQCLQIRLEEDYLKANQICTKTGALINDNEKLPSYICIVMTTIDIFYDACK